MSKNVFITGINKGLGKELFELFLTKEYTVYGLLRNQLVAEKLKRNLPENGKLILADVSTDESINAIQKVVSENPIDLLINNAGIGGKSHLIGKIDSDEINELFNIHCLGVFRTVKALETNLLKANEPLVLNLNSRLGSITRQGNGTYDHITVSYSYRIVKAAQNMLTNCLRKEFKGEIKFVSIHPGKMKTEIAQVDADIEPREVANRIIQFYENGKLIEENGITELGKELIEW
ncbi:MAG: SDR family NAD(P)-dependent oxidoreductase [Bacteroidia bacterium]